MLSEISCYTIVASGKWGEWPSGLRRCYQDWKVPVQISLGARLV